MKRLLLVLSLVCITIATRAQSALNYSGIEEVYRNFMLNSHSQFSKLILSDFNGVGGEKRFYSNNWENGGATNNFEYTIADGYLFNYDFVTQDLLAKWKDSVIAVNPSYVRRFYFEKFGQRHVFVKSPVLDPQTKYFYESLAFDPATNDSGKVQILKLRSVKIIKAKKDSYLANFSGDYSDELDNNIDYYIVLPNNTATKVKLNKKSILGALGTYTEKADTYLKSTKKIDEETVTGLIRYLNQG